MRGKSWIFALALWGMAAVPAAAQAAAPYKVGVVTFLSGAAAGPFGVPARYGAEVTAEALNAGQLPAPYQTKGIGGRPLELVFIDEAGGTTKQVSEYRNLVQRQNVDAVIGYISSGDCLAVAPVAEELQKLTILFDCGTPRIFEDNSYRYVFRTGPTGTVDAVAAALYVAETLPQANKIAGINQNYAWGHDSWGDFEAAMKRLKPGVQVVTSQMPKFLAGQYGAEISALITSGADVVHSSFWGGDMEAFVLQAAPRGLFQRAKVVLTTGETALPKLGTQVPEGTIVGARGPFGPFAPDNALNRWLIEAYEAKHKERPTYPAYKMSQALLGLKAAYEKAQEAGGGRAPGQDQVIDAFENLEYEGPGGTVRMALGKGHQAVMDTAYGEVKHEQGKAVVTKIRRYTAEQVNPPDGMQSDAWIKNDLKPVD